MWRSSFVKVAASIDSDADRAPSSVELIGRGLQLVVKRRAFHSGVESGRIEISEVPTRLQPDEAVLVPKRPGEELAAMPVYGWHNEGICLSVGFAPDVSFVGKVLSVRSLDSGERKGTFIAKELSKLQTLFSQSHQFRALRLMDQFLFDDNAFLIPSSTCNELDIKTGERLSLMRDPTIKPLEELLR